MFAKNFPSLCRCLGLSIFCSFLLLCPPFPAPSLQAALIDEEYSENTAADEKFSPADLERFTTTVDHIRNDYVSPTQDSLLFDNAIRGMLSGLDPHSAYLDEEEYAELKSNTSGKFGGIGIQVLIEDAFVRVISPIDDTPADKAGIQSGDLILRLDDTPVKGLTPKETLQRMRGDKGSTLRLTILRPGESKPLLFSVVRDIITTQSIKSKLLEEGYGYLRITQFQSNTGADLRRALQSLKKKQAARLKGLVLDLRNNPGGLLESSLEVCRAFLDKDKLKYDGVIVSARGRLPSSQMREKANGKDLLNHAPMVVLVNGGSASAAEIVAGALQDHRRALIVGSPTFGKGSIQTVFPLKNNRGLTLTTALYYTPSGNSIQASGIKPDILLENLTIPARPTDPEQLMLLKEEDLQRHLQTTAEDKKHKKANADASDGNSLLTTDYQLYEALNLLKGLALLGQARD